LPARFALEGFVVAPILTERSFDLITHSAAQTFALGELLGRLLQPGDIVCLQGNLGTGKTCLTQGIGAGMHVTGTINSPTFVLVAEHAPVERGPYLYHVDLYRIADYSEAYSLGLDDYVCGDGVTVIEWAERAADMLPHERLWINLTYADTNKRALLLQACGAHYVGVLAALRQAVFGAGSPAAARHPESP
jgi:tRNA threonylcarbamoyladenosine biosynthesis protein TsaE